MEADRLAAQLFTPVLRHLEQTLGPNEADVRLALAQLRAGLDQMPTSSEARPAPTLGEEPTPVTSYALGPGEGATYDWHGARISIKASGTDTHAQLAVMESVYPAGLVVPEHRHDGEDEMLYLVAGVLEGRTGSRTWRAEPGSFVFVSRDTPHGFTVTGGVPARALVVVGPPRLDRDIVATGVLVIGE